MLHLGDVNVGSVGECSCFTGNDKLFLFAVFLIVGNESDRCACEGMCDDDFLDESDRCADFTDDVVPRGDSAAAVVVSLAFADFEDLLEERELSDGGGGFISGGMLAA
uniref:Secreted protein n=1 Tax=Angiostrongylus cantonensis TaxID=6313 RepID=A0A0K0DQJ3_ANGCA